MNTNTFENFSNTFSGRLAAGLLKEYSATATKKLWDVVYLETVFALPYLMKGEKYTAEKLCGPDAWSSWRKVERRVAGSCLAYLVKVGVIPLVLHITPSGTGKKRYCLPSMKAGVATLPTDVRGIFPCDSRSLVAPSSCI